MSLQFPAPCGHMGTADAPCNCYVRRHGMPVTDTLPGTITQHEWIESLDCHCHVGQVRQPTDTPFGETVEDACRAKWEAGRRLYGAEFVGDPLEELYGEYLDALNYFDELDRRGLLSEDLVYARLSTRRLAELVRAEGQRRDKP